LLRNTKVIGIYVSASWCGPCQRFTPELASFYKEMSKKGKKFEVVWISQDRTSEDFQNYYFKMPWLAVPVQSLQNAMGIISSPKYGLKGIPHLVILDADDGTIIATDGREKVAIDKYGLEFPWRKRTLANMIPKPFKKFLVVQLKNIVLISKRVLAGVLSGLAPKKLYGYYITFIHPTATVIINGIINKTQLFIKSKLLKNPATV